MEKGEELIAVDELAGMMQQAIVHHLAKHRELPSFKTGALSLTAIL
jgi:hypothetical protein